MGICGCFIGLFALKKMSSEVGGDRGTEGERGGLSRVTWAYLGDGNGVGEDSVSGGELAGAGRTCGQIAPVSLCGAGHLGSRAFRRVYSSACCALARE
jgi:hypothetical protein